VGITKLGKSKFADFMKYWGVSQLSPFNPLNSELKASLYLSLLRTFVSVSMLWSKFWCLSAEISTLK